MNETVQGHRLLQQYIEQQPDALAAAIMGAMHAGDVVWRTPSRMAPPPQTPPGSDAAEPPRWRNLDFLGQGKARRAWAEVWPQESCDFAWDAIGRAQMGEVGWEWLLVAAYAHPGELDPIAPSNRPADERVAAALAQAQERYHAAPGSDWRRADDPLAIRLAALSFLRQYSVCSRLLFVYFYDDAAPANAAGSQGALCPSREAWSPAIAAAERRLGLAGASVLERRLYRAFLPSL